MHSILVPALAQLTDCFILEYPIRRGHCDSNGRVDYCCINNFGKSNEYRLFLELKCGRQGLTNAKNFRKKNIELWNEVNEQLEGISQEIQQHEEFYDKPIMRVSMEVITLYIDESRSNQINSETLKEVLYSSTEVLKRNGSAPNISVLWEFHPNIVERTFDEFNDSRLLRGLLFLCRVMPPILPERK